MSELHKCLLCGGSMEKKMIKFDLWVDNSLIVIESVPAEVCVSCGEETFDPQVSKQIDQIAKTRKNPTKEMTIPVFSLAA